MTSKHVSLIALFFAFGCEQATHNRVSEDRRPDETPAPRVEHALPAPTANNTPAENAKSNEPGTAKLEVGGGAATCQPSSEVEQAVMQFIAMADSDRDGALSDLEANELAGSLVGAMLLKADGNHDGTISPEEGDAVRREILTAQPALASLLAAVQDTTGESPFKRAAQLFELDKGKSVTFADVKGVAADAVRDLFALVDTDKDHRITGNEARDAAMRGAVALGHGAFQSADQNGDAKLTVEEFQAALKTPMEIAFKAADADKNGELTEDEASKALAQIGGPIASQLRVTRPEEKAALNNP
jgi:hypothetical protein